MKIGKLLSAIGNLNQIAEGVKNKIFKKEDVEEVAAERWKKCLICPSLDRAGYKCAMVGTQPCCADCGCSLGLKLRALSSSCPKGHWNSVMTSEQENEVKKAIYPKLKEREEKRQKELKVMEEIGKRNKLKSDKDTEANCPECNKKKKKIMEALKKTKDEFKK